MDDTASIKRDIKVLNDNQIELIVSLFEKSDITLDILYIIRRIERIGKYTVPQRIVRDALRDGLLYVDSIESDNTIMVALTDWGEQVWEKQHE